MKLINDINVVASNNFIELMALKTESDGMIAENHCRTAAQKEPAYDDMRFFEIAEKMRALKKDELIVSKGAGK